MTQTTRDARVHRLHAPVHFFGQECLTLKLSEQAAEHARLEEENRILRADRDALAAKVGELDAATHYRARYEEILIARLKKADEIVASLRDEVAHMRADMDRRTGPSIPSFCPTNGCQVAA